MATAASSEMEEVLRRLDALEARVTEALGQVSRWAHRAHLCSLLRVARQPTRRDDSQHTLLLRTHTRTQGGDTQPGSAPPGAAADGWGRRERQPLGKDANVTEQMADTAADMMEDAAADAVQKLHPALINFLNR